MFDVSSVTAYVPITAAAFVALACIVAAFVLRPGGVIAWVLTALPAPVVAVVGCVYAGMTARGAYAEVIALGHPMRETGSAVLAVNGAAADALALAAVAAAALAVLGAWAAALAPSKTPAEPMGMLERLLPVPFVLAAAVPLLYDFEYQVLAYAWPAGAAAAGMAPAIALRRGAVVWRDAAIVTLLGTIAAVGAAHIHASVLFETAEILAVIAPEDRARVAAEGGYLIADNARLTVAVSLGVAALVAAIMSAMRKSPTAALGLVASVLLFGLSLAGLSKVPGYSWFEEQTLTLEDVPADSEAAPDP